MCVATRREDLGSVDLEMLRHEQEDDSTLSQAQAYDVCSQGRNLVPGEQIWVNHPARKERWTPGKDF